MGSQRAGHDWVTEQQKRVSSSLWPHGLYSPWNSPGQNTGVGSLSLLQQIFPSQGSNPCLLHCRQSVYHLSHQGSPRIPLKVKVKSLSPVRLFATPWTIAYLTPPLHGILQARVLEWVAISFSRGIEPRNRTQVSCIADRFFTNWSMNSTRILNSQ